MWGLHHTPHLDGPRRVAAAQGLSKVQVEPDDGRLAQRHHRRAKAGDLRHQRLEDDAQRAAAGAMEQGVRVCGCVGVWVGWGGGGGGPRRGRAAAAQGKGALRSATDEQRGSGLGAEARFPAAAGGARGAHTSALQHCWTRLQGSVSRGAARPKRQRPRAATRPGGHLAGVAGAGGAPDRQVGHLWHHARRLAASWQLDRQKDVGISRPSVVHLRRGRRGREAR